jgi:hypothetical protein
VVLERNSAVVNLESCSVVVAASGAEVLAFGSVACAGLTSLVVTVTANPVVDLAGSSNPSEHVGTFRCFAVLQAVAAPVKLEADSGKNPEALAGVA